MKFLRKTFCALYFIAPLLMHSQTVNIGGIINIYTPLNAIDTTKCPTTITVQSASGFTVGDRVFIIQMKGAKFDTSNTVNFGSVINLNCAGNNEIAVIKSITGNVIKLNGKLVKRYQVNGKVQLVRIPQYKNANVINLLTCLPWNGQTGGVLIFEVQNNLVLNSNIDVSGRGFRGGKISKNPDGSCGTGSLGYHYPIYQPSVYPWNVGGAQKGEGIGEIDTARQAGRGPIVNGGGGGNKHNTGGGGGSNVTAGGKGGDGLVGCGHTTGGLGGIALGNYYNSGSLFVGGGGGCGDDNNQVGSAGENGGAIAIVSAGNLTANNFTIRANGNSVTVVAYGIADGAGGGGAGGSIFLKVNSITGTVNVEANGGDGGDQNPQYGCVGPGGGGGTGAVLTSLSSLTNVSSLQSPGAAGLVIATSLNCSNTNYGAIPGSTNTSGLLINKNLTYTPDSINSCGLIIAITELNNLTASKLLVYPDPASSAIHIECEMGLVGTVRIYDCTGRTVYSSEEMISVKKQVINIENLREGLYVLEISDSSGTRKARFVKN